MKKSLVLTAIAATLAAPAFAQSSVTIYGRLNVSIESYKVGRREQARLARSGQLVAHRLRR
jgi:predicted porin